MPDEKIRIFNNRGETRQSNLDKKSKIYVRARMYPGLSISRSLGDLLAHHIGVTSEPEVAIRDIEQGDKFLTIATDGVWSHLGAEDVGEIVSEFGLGHKNISFEKVREGWTVLVSYIGRKNGKIVP